VGAEDEYACHLLCRLDDPALGPELRDALDACLAEQPPAYWAEALADLGEELAAYLFDRADRLVLARREARRAELRAMPYREYLRTAEWRERADQTYERFGGHCALQRAE
jgi:hypothetical protein